MQAVLDVLSQTEASSLFLVQRKGPTCFVVCEGEEGSDKHRVMLGARTTCSCRQPNIDSQSASAMPCVHIMFIMTKVLRIPSDDPLAWKLTLTGMTHCAHLQAYCLTGLYDYASHP